MDSVTDIRKKLGRNGLKQALTLDLAVKTCKTAVLNNSQVTKENIL